MENEISEPKNFKLGFDGKGGALFGIIIVNWLLTVITLGFYYPWAKAKQLKFMYGATTLNGDRFAFTGTGKEMFKGYIKALVIFGVIYGVLILSIYFDYLYAGLIFFYFTFLAILPVIIHGSYRYRMSRTSWRGIRFGYRGDRTELFINYFKWFFFTIITLGIYGSWMEMKLRKYLIGNIRLGDIEFRYDGKGLEYFLLGLKGLVLTILTLGIYSFWFYKQLFAYYIDNMSLYKNGKKINFKSTLTAGNIFSLVVVNYLLLIFTLGLGYAWVMTRSMNIIFSNIEMEGDIDPDTIIQTEADYNDATGEDMSDFLNIDLVF
ncbi:YjgN family protein [Flavobacterium sp. UBA6031]|uniref:YjgN family protein n=1 Tax=Flavobacterium sp. UBA6031 TaxID=1946551 RepID=UPI0025BD6B3A|nr:YjgN family protein [Flavobacterium sp. UBA6031]